MRQKDISSATQIAILNAASRVILEKGAEALTLDAVAQAAGISKGGLLYHYPSKKKLIEGMVSRLIGGVDAAIEKELSNSAGDYLTAYIRVSFETNPERDRISCALSAAIANNPDLLKPLQARYLEWQDRAAAAAPSPEIGTLIRLALDGLWISDLLVFAPPSPAMREKMLHRLLLMVKKAD
ncbi:MAG: TetR/AcrR family transcriptional regulator [Anaerolineaceae bacterium]|nr:TetR/AcrR family transcriptional regulator [Anaerolineaceae bacterium]